MGRGAFHHQGGRNRIQGNNSSQVMPGNSNQQPPVAHMAKVQSGVSVPEVPQQQWKPGNQFADN